MSLYLIRDLAEERPRASVLMPMMEVRIVRMRMPDRLVNVLV